MSILSLLIGLVLILFGARYLIDGASGLAKRLGISEFIIGLTIVGIGTSTPELVVSVISAFDGNGALAIGNVVGSNIVNVLLILGVTAAIRPMPLTANNLWKDIPFGMLASLVLVIMASGRFLDGTPSDRITRTDGLLLLCFFAVFMAYSVFAAKNKPALAGVARNGAATGQDTQQAVPAAAGPASGGLDTSQPDKNRAGFFRRIWQIFGFGKGAPAAGYSVGVLLLLVVIGLVALIFGGRLFVDGAVAIARGLGVSEAVIAVTLIALGTSLPELATSVVAAIKGNVQLALGNVIGSNIINIFLILGVSASITPLQFGGISGLDIGVMAGASVLLFFTYFSFRRRTIDRPEGVLFLLLYAAYLWVLISKS